MPETKDDAPATEAPLSKVSVRSNWVVDQTLDPMTLAPHYKLSDDLTSASKDGEEEGEED